MISTIIILLAIIGFSVSLYAYKVEIRVKHDQEYRPACDISNRISCSKVAKSPYSTLFLISNSLLGLLYYFLIIALTVIHSYVLLFFLSLVGVLASIYLAYLLFFKIKVLCVLCTTVYAVNILICLLSFIQMRGM
jgi:vitamin-K-epoxide reductase (warfarin-sensitive)